MRRRNKLKIRRSIKLSYVLWIVLFLIILNTIILLNIFNTKINPKLQSIVKMSMDKNIDNVITTYSLREDYDTIKNILLINKNKNDEIINVDYDLPSLYNFSAKITRELKEDFENIDYYDKNLSNNKYFVLNVPLGVISNNAYLSNLGPKIPIKIRLIGSILTGVKTKITSYGINNSLIEVYTTIDISSLILTPVATKKEKSNFKILVASKIIEGKVPDIYGGSMTKDSNLVSEKNN